MSQLSRAAVDVLSFTSAASPALGARNGVVLGLILLAVHVLLAIAILAAVNVLWRPTPPAQKPATPPAPTPCPDPELAVFDVLVSPKSKRFEIAETLEAEHRPARRARSAAQTVLWSSSESAPASDPDPTVIVAFEPTLEAPMPQQPSRRSAGATVCLTSEAPPSKRTP